MTSRNAGRDGLALAILSAATFGLSGPFAAALLDAGWSPAAAVTARITTAAVVLTIPAIRQLRGRWSAFRRGLPLVAGYGLIAVAGCQLFYFNALARLSVGVALLLEYLGTILVVGWLWVRHGQRPRRLTISGGVVAIIGLVLVLGLTSSHRLDPVGVLWGLAAAAGLAVYFVLSAKSDDSLPPLLVAWGGMCLGTISLIVLDVSGALTVRAPLTDVVLLNHRVSWLVPVLGLSLVAAVIAYLAGIGAARRLGPKLAAFLGLTEVVFAVIFAWLLLAQVPSAQQLLGGLLIIGGVVLVRIDELGPARTPTAGSNASISTQT